MCIFLRVVCVEVVVEVSEVMVLSIWYPVGEGWKFLVAAGGDILSAIVTIKSYKSQRKKSHMGDVQTEKFAYEGVRDHKMYGYTF